MGDLVRGWMFFSVLTALVLAAYRPAASQEVESGEAKPQVFSGPQKGEKLPPLEVLLLWGENAGEKIDLAAVAGEKPFLVVFLHKLTRPAAGLIRILTHDAAERGESGLSTAVVWLTDDHFAVEKRAQRIRRPLDWKATTVGVSLDGIEGPGAYGLHRDVTMTVLVGHKGVVTANFALVQPSDTDAPRVVQAVVELVGGKALTLEDVERMRRYRGRRMRVDPELRKLLGELEKKELSEAMVEDVAARVLEYVGDDRRRRRSLGQLCQRFIARDDFEERGTARARAEIRSWAKAYGGRQRRGLEDPRFDSLMRAVIQKDKTPAQVDQAAAELEKYVAGKPRLEETLGIRCRRIVSSKPFAEGGYGIPRAREHLKRWAEAPGTSP